MCAQTVDQRVLVSLNDAAEMTSLSRAAINRHRAAGNFPVPVQLGERRIGFVRLEVLDWIEGRVADRSFGRSRTGMPSLTEIVERKSSGSPEWLQDVAG